MKVIEAESGVTVELSEEESKRGMVPADFYKVNREAPSDDVDALHAVDPSLASYGLRKGHVTELVTEEELESLCYQRVGSENWIREGGSVPTRW